jgi:hypothetical protein
MTAHATVLSVSGGIVGTALLAYQPISPIFIFIIGHNSVRFGFRAFKCKVVTHKTPTSGGFDLNYFFVKVFI